MVGTNCRWITMRKLLSFLMAGVLALSLVACGDRPESPPSTKNNNLTKTQLSGSIVEVAPPTAIQQLSQSLAVYQPQVSILSPQGDQILPDTTVTVELMVQDLPIFQDSDLGMGPHLEVILDNLPYTMVYDLKQPLVFADLAPGTHTLRVVAATPWHESFKNEGAYAQTTFHIFTKTTDNNPDSALPLLTYSRPTGSYGAEPIMLDFYLNNAPLHLVAQENTDDAIADWRIRATVNGQSFILDRWQSIYLKGFKPGKNWVQLEFLDEQGNPVKNVFNNTVRLIDYQPKGKDTLSQLIRGEISAVAARGIVEQGYKTQPETIPTPNLSPEVIPIEIPAVTPIPEATPSQPAIPETETKPSEPQKSGGFFSRFRRQPETLTPSPEVIVPEEPELIPVPQATQTPIEIPIPVEELPPIPETPKPNDESATAKPKLDLKEVFLSSPVAPETKIIEAPSEDNSEIPEHFFKKSASEPKEPEVLVTPEASPLP